MESYPRWRRRQTLVNPEHQLPFTWVLLLQMTAVMVTIASFGFIESSRTMDLVLKHLADFPLASNNLHQANQAFLAKVMLVLGMTAMVQILFGLYTSHKLAGPVLKMTRALEKAAAGDLAQRVSFRKGDHLEDLALTLNRMLASFAADQAHLKAEAEEIERTVTRLRGCSSLKLVDAAEVVELHARIAALAGEKRAPEVVAAGRGRS